MSSPTERLNEIADGIEALSREFPPWIAGNSISQLGELASELHRLAAELAPPFEQVMMRERERADGVYAKLDRVRDEVFAHSLNDELPAETLMRAIDGCRQVRRIDDHLAKLEDSRSPAGRTPTEALTETAAVRELRYELRARTAWLRVAKLPGLEEIPEIEEADEQ